LKPFTSHLTSAKGAFQYFKSTADFQLYFNGYDIGISIYIGISNIISGITDSDVANNRTNSK